MGGAAILPTPLPEPSVSGFERRYDCRVAAALCRSLIANHFSSQTHQAAFLFLVCGGRRERPPPGSSRSHLNLRQGWH